MRPRAQAAVLAVFPLALAGCAETGEPCGPDRAVAGGRCASWLRGSLLIGAHLVNIRQLGWRVPVLLLRPI